MPDNIEAAEKQKITKAAQRTPAKPLPRYLTRRQACAYASETLGVPMKEGTYAKRAMQGRGMKPDLYYGRTELFTPETVERYVLGELTGNKPFSLET